MNYSGRSGLVFFLGEQSPRDAAAPAEPEAALTLLAGQVGGHPDAVLRQLVAEELHPLVPARAGKRAQAAGQQDLSLGALLQGALPAAELIEQRDAGIAVPRCVE